MKNLFSVEQKVILITGATGVLGSEMVRHFAEQKAIVIILGRNNEVGEKLEQEVKEQGQEAFFIAADVLDRDTLERAAECVLAKYGRIDVLINGAGGNVAGATIAPTSTIFDLDTEAFKQVVDLNLHGTVLPTIVFSKSMAQAKQGVIINISSESAIRPLTRICGYGVAKAAVTNFTKSMAGEMALKFGDGIRVNAVAPGFFITEQNRALLLEKDGSYSDRANTIIKHTPFGRFGTPDELLGTLQWLASDASKFVTGTLIVVDGGFDAFAI